jgi:hypothetical protein
MSKLNADDIINQMMAHQKFMAIEDTDEIEGLIEHTHRYLDKRLKIEGKLLIFPYEDTMETLLIQGLDISEQLASILVSSWEEKRLGDYYGVRYSNGDEIWKFRHYYHSENDIPARSKSVLREWYKYGSKHRDNDLPAVIYDINNENSRKEWWFNGRLHRTNGQPAVVDINEIRYFVYGQEVNNKIAKLF